MDSGETIARILNVGRTRRRAYRHQRRAIIARQGGECAALGCHNTHLENHQGTWWSRGGHADLDDMIGLCVRCHHLVHRELFNIEPDRQGQFDFTTETGRPVERGIRPRVAHRPREFVQRTDRRVPLGT